MPVKINPGHVASICRAETCCSMINQMYWWILCRGVAKFEQFCAEHEVEGVTFEVLTRLYEDPNNLDSLPNDKLKLLARSIIQQTMDER